MNNHDEAIITCRNCYQACLVALTFHRKIDEKPLSQIQIKQLMSCMEFCQITANMLTIGSPSVDRFCELCAHLCEQCADACIAIDNKVMKLCIAACRYCAGACYEESYHLKQAC
jgi:hypothetical protein